MFCWGFFFICSLLNRDGNYFLYKMAKVIGPLFHATMQSETKCLWMQTTQNCNKSNPLESQFIKSSYTGWGRGGARTLSQKHWAHAHFWMFWNSVRKPENPDETHANTRSICRTLHRQEPKFRSSRTLELPWLHHRAAPLYRFVFFYKNKL